MRKQFYIFPLLLSAMLIFSGCVKEQCSRVVTAKLYTPVLMAKADIIATNARIQEPQEIGHSGKIYIKDNYIFVNEPRKGIHIIDNSNPGAPVKLSFLKVLGNVDMAVKGNYLYADSYQDLLVFDIRDPKNVRHVKSLNEVLGYAQTENGMPVGYAYYTPDSLVVDYVERDTTYTCPCEDPRRGIMFASEAAFTAFSSAKAGDASTGKGGSMARFTIAKDHLYTVNFNMLTSFDIQNAASPVFREKINAGWGIETIFPYGDNLFIGSQSAMYIYGLANPAKPERKSTVTHFRACDPVVVEGTTAYVTIRSGTTCAGTFNQLQVFDVKDVENPVKLATYELKNPHGLGIDRGKLFICEGAFGLRFLNAPDPAKITTAKLVEGLNAYDVIPFNSGDRLLVSAEDGIYQYNYTSLSSPALVSKITVKRTTR
jgi:hypothetical protein